MFSRNSVGKSNNTNRNKKGDENKKRGWFTELRAAKAAFSFWIFSGIPEHYPLKKKITLLMTNTQMGMFWDIMLIVCSLIASCFYIVETYTDAAWATVQWLHSADTVFTSLFTIDFVLGCMMAPHIFFYVFSLTTLVDLATFVPYYVQLAVQGLHIKLSIFRFLKIYRLIRIMRLFKSMRNISGPTRQMIILLVTLFCFVLIGAGIFQLFENDIKQLMQYDCNYVGPNFEPSCDPILNYQPGCDCSLPECHTFYNAYDPIHEPSGIDCGTRTYFKCVYFIVVTVSTLGYGDIAPTTAPSRALVLVMMLLSFIVIPIQIQELATALASVSTYRRPHKQANDDDQHVIVCGNIHNRLKVERFLAEFYHPTRTLTRDSEIKVILLCPMEPTEDIKDLLLKEAFSSRVSYLVGSALSIDDLKRAGAHIAKAVFFLCNSAVNEDGAALDDAANILRSLNIVNYNNQIECYAQIIRSNDCEILRDSNVDVVLCLDEFRLTMQARNAVCPGISTLIENLFTTFGDLESVAETQLKNAQVTDTEISDNWLTNYIRGAEMEMYYVPLSPKYMVTMGYMFSFMAEGIFLEFGAMMVGVCCKGEMSMILNPSPLETNAYESLDEFYKVHDTGVLMTESYEMAAFIAQCLDRDEIIEKIIAKMIRAEDVCHVRSSKDTSHSTFKSITAFAKAAKNESKKKNSSHDLTRKSSLAAATESCLPMLGLGNDSTKKSVLATELYKTIHEYKKSESAHLEESALYVWLRDVAEKSLGDPAVTHSFVGHVERTITGSKGMTKAALKKEAKQKQRQQRSTVASGKFIRGPVTSTLLIDKETFYDSGSDNEDEADSDANSNTNRAKRHSVLSTGSSLGHRSRTGSADIGSATAVTVVESFTNDANRTGVNFATDSLSRDSSVGVGGGSTNDSGKSHHSQVPPSSHSPVHHHNNSTSGPSMGSLNMSGKDNARDHHLQLFNEYSAFGHASREIENATHLSNHVVVFGSDRAVNAVVSELRKPLIAASAYRVVVYVGETVPSDWKHIAHTYDDVFWIRGNMLNSSDFNRAHIKTASSVVLFANRENLTVIDQDNLDTGALFAYLALEKHIPKSLFFTIELLFESNIASLNSSMMPRLLSEALKVKKLYQRSEKERIEAVLIHSTVDASTQDLLGISSSHPRGIGKPPWNWFRSTYARVFVGSDASVSSPLSHDHHLLGPTQAMQLAAQENHNNNNSNNNNNALPQMRTPLSGKNGGSGNDGVGPPYSGGRGGSASGRGSVEVSPVNSAPVSARGTGPDLSEMTGHTNARRHSIYSGMMTASSMMGAARPNEKTQHNSLFSIQSTHHTLPVFASGSAFVPTAMDTILSNCFFDPMAPLMCERLLCGQKHKTMLQIDLPLSFVGRKFVDIFRAFLSKNLLILGIRRSSSMSDKSLLPYVFTCPPRSTELKADDRLFVFCSPVELDYAMQKYDAFSLTTEKRRSSVLVTNLSSKPLDKDGGEDESVSLKWGRKPLGGFSGKPMAYDLMLTARYTKQSVDRKNSALGGGLGQSSKVARIGSLQNSYKNMMLTNSIAAVQQAFAAGSEKNGDNGENDSARPLMAAGGGGNVEGGREVTL